MTPLTVNLFLAIAVVIFFLVQGMYYFREIYDEESFFLYGRKLASSEYSPSFAAASTSLATALFFFTVLSAIYGVYMLIAPFTYLLGCYLYCRFLLPPLSKQGFFKVRDPDAPMSLGTTLAAYVQERYSSSGLKYSIIFVTFAGLSSILLIEFFIGVSIFSIYLKEDYVDWALVLISVAVFTYAGFGGLPAVVKTDVAQLVLMVLAAVVLLGWLVWSAYSTQRLPVVEDFFTDPLHGPAGPWGWLALQVNIVAVNLLLIPALLRTWQMAAATSSSSEVRTGLMGGAWITMALAALFMLIGIFFFKGVFPDAELSLIAMLDGLRLYSSGFAQYVVFPLFFAACLAALVSTADSALLPLVQTVVQDFRPKVKERQWKHSEVLLICGVILAVELLLYFLVFRVLEFDMIRWLFTIFSFLVIATPCIVTAVIAPPAFLNSRVAKIGALVSIWGGLTVVVAVSLVGNALKDLAIVQLNSPLGALFSSLTMGATWLIYSKKDVRQEVAGGTRKWPSKPL